MRPQPPRCAKHGRRWREADALFRRQKCDGKSGEDFREWQVTARAGLKSRSLIRSRIGRPTRSSGRCSIVSRHTSAGIISGLATRACWRGVVSANPNSLPGSRGTTTMQRASVPDRAKATTCAASGPVTSSGRYSPRANNSGLSWRRSSVLPDHRLLHPSIPPMRRQCDRWLGGVQRSDAPRKFHWSAIVGIHHALVPELRALIDIRHARHRQLQQGLRQAVHGAGRPDAMRRTSDASAMNPPSAMIV